MSLKIQRGTVEERGNEYRYKLLRDTLRIIERDSIPYPVTVTKAREARKPPSRLVELARAVFIVVIASLALWLVMRNKT